MLRLALWLLAAFAVPAGAQIPSVSLSGLPATPLIGEQFCVDASFTNTDSSTGYGPYLITVVDPFIQGISIDFVDIQPVLEKIGDFDSSGVLVDPISGLVLNGTEGGSAWIARYPIGSVDQGQPELVMTVCAVVETGADIGVPLAVEVTPGFEFGDTTVGTNGAITGTAQSSTVTPQLARVSKGNSAPEGERPPGPSHPFQYTWTVDISEGVSIENLVLTDILPNQIQWTGAPITVNAPLGDGCAVTSTPTPPMTPGGTAEVQCTSVLGAASPADLTVTVPVYISDILSGTAPDSESITNTVSFDFDYQGAPEPTVSDTSTVQAEYATLQKSVSGTGLPGGTLTYLLNFQLTDYPDAPPGAANTFVISDVIPDGLQFDGTLALVIDGTSFPITPTVTPGPGAGETSVIWDIAAATSGGQLNNGATGSLTYATTILQTYDNGDPVQASDGFSNTAVLDYTLSAGGSGNNSSSIDASIQPNVPNKSIVSPNPPPPVLEPGEEVVFELSLSVPAGNTSDVLFVDFLPRPVFDVSDFVPSDLEILTPFSALTPTVSTDVASNSVSIDFGDITTPIATVLRARLTARIVGTPFADSLFLTNLLQTSYTNTNGNTITDLRAVGGTVGAPSLVVTKGVTATDNPAAVITPAPPSDPSQATADSDVRNVDAFDVISYVVTVENVGTTNAYNVTIDDTPPSSELLCVEPTVGDIVDGNGSVLDFSGTLAGGLLLADPLAPNDGSEGAPYGADTALLTLRCSLSATVEPLETFTNEAGATWTSVPDPAAPFPRVSDRADAVIAAPQIAKVVNDIAPGYSNQVRRTHIGEIVTYTVTVTVPEGTSTAVRLEDQVPNGMAFVDVLSITTNSPDVITSVGSFNDVIANAGFLARGGGETAPDRRLVFGPAANDNGFGTVSNSNSDNATIETIDITYRAKVLNARVNNNGTRRRNRARWLWQSPGEPRRRVQTRAAAIRVVEPALSLNKTFAPDTGDDASPPLLSLVLNHTGGSAADAFDVVLSDALPSNMVVVGGVDTSLCANQPDSPPTVTEVMGRDVISASWAEFDRGFSCTLQVQTGFTVPPPAGADFLNCAEVLWESLRDGDQPLAMPPNNTLGVERTGDDTDPGQVNDYRLEACDAFKVFDVGISKRVVATDQAHTDNIPSTDPAREALTIGETVTFELVVTIPEVTVDELEVLDLLPITDNVLELVSARTLRVGADLTPDDPDPSPVIDDRDSDGVNDRVLLNYGRVEQAADGSTDDDDRIEIEVVAKVRDVLVNENNDKTSNTGLVRFNGGLNSSDDAGLELVEPLLQVEKFASASEAEAGDTITYTLRLSHTAASRIDAKDVTLEDLVPTELNVVPGSVVLGAACTEAPSTGPAFVAGAISATWTTFPFDAVCEIDYDVSVDISAVVGQAIVNTTEANWTSLDTQGDADDRAYEAKDQWTLNISQPGLAKELTTTDQDGTVFVLNSGLQELTIGETGTFTIVADFPDGTTEQVSVFDELPTTDVALRITGTRIVSVGADLTVTTAPATDCSGGAQTCVQWSLGDVVNQPDNRPEPDLDDSIVFEVDVIVLDDPLNSGEDTNVPNTSRLDSLNLDLVATATFNIVEPLLEITKLTENLTLPGIIAASETHRFELEIDHQGQSSAQANTLVVTDVMDSNILWVNDGTVSSDCPGFAIDSSPTPGSSGTVQFSADALSLGQQTCSIHYDVEAQALLPVPGRFPNTVTLDWESAPGSAESRTGQDQDENALVSFSTASLSKIITGTSVPDTSAAVGNPLLDDLVIGEEVNYRIVAAFSEGTTSNVVLIDTIDAAPPDGPSLEFVSGNVISVGDNLTTSEPGDPVVSPANVITIDYGTVENFGDNIFDEDDTIVYELVARVIDVPNNVSGTILTNTIDLSFAPSGSESTTVDLEVVEPVLGVSKTFTDLTAGLATIEIVLNNSGNAAGYELGFIDEFDEGFWIPGSLTPITVPTGFTLTEASAAGITTVTLATEGDPSKPEEVLAPGETLTVIFTMELINGGIVGVPQIDNTVEAETSSLPGVNPAERIYQANATDSLLFPDLSLDKSWSGANNPARPGDTLTYTLALRNTGPNAATEIVITDTPDAIGEFQSGSVTASAGGVVDTGNSPGDTSIRVSFPSLGAAATATVTYDVIVPLPYPDGGTAPQELVNQASADSKEQQGIVSDDPATADPNDPTVVPIDADPVMTVNKDDQVLLTAPGATLVYRIDYGNIGNQNATGVVLSETVPANTVYSAAASTPGWSCADGSPAGTSCELTLGALPVGGDSVDFAVLVDTPLPPAVSDIDNTVQITDDGIEFDPNDPVVPSTDAANEITPIGGAFPQLQIDKDDGGIFVTPGQRYNYLIDYANIGNQGATGVVITETVPDDVIFSAAASLPTRWSCPNGSPPGTQCSVVIPLLLAGVGNQVQFGLDVIFPAAAGRELIVNGVDITDDGANSPTPSTDRAGDTTPLVALPDIYVEKVADRSLVQQGDSILYTAEYGNQGNQNATGVIIRERVPEGAVFNASDSSPTIWSCADGSPGGTICEYQAGAVVVGFMESLLFAIDIVDTPRSREIVNVIEGNDDLSNGIDPTPENNIDRVITPFPTLVVNTLTRPSLMILVLLTLLLGAQQRKLLGRARC